jgi:hypothetical protein
MASTFTLKRKTYTAWDYKNEIADCGFKEGFDYACEKMFGWSPILEETAARLGGKYAYPINASHAKDAMKGRLDPYLAKKLGPGFEEDVRKTYHKIGSEPKWREHYERENKVLNIGKGKQASMSPNNYGRVA